MSADWFQKSLLTFHILIVALCSTFCTERKKFQEIVHIIYEIMCLGGAPGRENCLRNLNRNWKTLRALQRNMLDWNHFSDMKSASRISCQRINGWTQWKAFGMCQLQIDADACFRNFFVKKNLPKKVSKFQW